ncbi:MAG: hypothetical protein AAF389_17905 [Gemmatimonadota bacterium]
MTRPSFRTARRATAAIALVLALPTPSHAQPRDTLDVFFLGNSYVYYNTLPEQLTEISRALDGPHVRTSYHLRGGFTLRRHLDGGLLPAAIVDQRVGAPHDIVVLQEQSRLGVPYRDPETGSLGGSMAFLEAAREAVHMVRELGSEPFFYMTWAKEAFPGQTDDLASAYHTAAEEADARLAPVGLAWAAVRKDHPEIRLFHPDGSHPSPAGTYLAACVFYAVLTGHDPTGAPTEIWGTEVVAPGVARGDEPVPLVRLTPEMAATLQAVAWRAAQPYLEP